MQGLYNSTTYIQSLQGCVHYARDDRKVVCTLQRLMQGCHKLAVTLQGCNNLAAGCHNPYGQAEAGDKLCWQLGVLAKEITKLIQFCDVFNYQDVNRICLHLL